MNNVFAKAQYVVKADKSASKESIEERLKNLRPDSIAELGSGRFIIFYKKDPGFKALEKVSTPDFSIGPNFKYKAHKMIPD